MARIPDRLKDSSGFALALAIFALVLLAAVVAGGYFSASQEFQIGRGMRSLTTSVYTGEAGIYNVLDDWDPEVMQALQPGDTLTFGPVNMEGGGAYTTRVVRVGRAADSVKRYFYIEAVGQTPLPTLGARRQAMVVRARFPKLCCQAAAKLWDEVEWTSGGGPPDRTQISGLDLDPPAWDASVCAGIPTTDLPGVLIRNAGLIQKPGSIKGSPQAIVQDGSISRYNAFSFTGGMTYDDIAQLADITLAPGASLSGISAPIVDANGECDRTSDMNWGETANEAHACFDYFPIIHALGSLTLVGAGSGQGILLVEGDLTLQGPFTFYGIVLLRPSPLATGSADLQLNSQATLYGGVIGEDVDFSGPNSEVIFSDCAVKRAERLSNLTRPVPVSPRAWVQLF